MKNGSGKSLIVEAISVLKTLLLGKPLEDEAVSYIRIGSNHLKCTFDFYLIPHDDSYPKLLITYSFTLSRDIKEGIIVKNENLKYKSIAKNGAVTSGKIIEYDIEDKLYSSSFMTQENMRALRSYSKDAYKKLEACLQSKKNQRSSFIFNCDNLNILTKAFNDDVEIKEPLSCLRSYASSYLFIIKNNLLSFPLCSEDNNFLTPFIHRLTTSSLDVHEDELQTIRTYVDKLNVVLKTIIPLFNIEIEDDDEYIREDKSMRKLVLYSNHNGQKLPFEYESDGIKKLVSILGGFIDLYNDPSVTLVIDDLDTNLDEYIFGELLKILKENGLGQLFFTSHNLRPLELLDYKSLFFTTVNPKNRYTKLTDIKTNNNVRDVYYTSIQVGTKEDDLYEMVDSFTIKNALFEAGFNLEE